MISVPSQLKRKYRHLRQVLGDSKSELLKQRSITIGDRDYRLPTYEQAVLSFTPSYEEWLDPVYELVLNHKKGAFIDVGVNRGQTLAKILRLDPTRRYVGFEPQSSCAYLISEFLKINGLDNHTVVSVGLSDEDAICELMYRTHGAADGTASIAAKHRPPSFYVRSSFIPVLRGDKVIRSLRLEDIACIKIDVEGAELEVLHGLEKTIQEFMPYIVFEVLNNYLAATGEALDEETTAYRNERAKDISHFLSALGYRIYNIRSDGFVHTDLIRPEVSHDLSITDYVAVPRDLILSITSEKTVFLADHEPSIPIGQAG